MSDRPSPRPTPGGPARATATASPAAADAGGVAPRDSTAAVGTAAGGPPAGRPGSGSDTVAGGVRVTLRVIAAAGLGVSGYVHLVLARNYPVGSPITQSTAFRLQAAACLVAGLLLLRRGRWAVLPALLVAAGSLGAVLLTRYVHVNGTLPVLQYEPAWYYRKSLSAVAEAVSTLTCLAVLPLTPRVLRRH